MNRLEKVWDKSEGTERREYFYNAPARVEQQEAPDKAIPQPVRNAASGKHRQTFNWDMNASSHERCI